MTNHGSLPTINYMSPAQKSAAVRQANGWPSRHQNRPGDADRFDQMLRNARRDDRPEPTRPDRHKPETGQRATDGPDRRTTVNRSEPKGVEPDRGDDQRTVEGRNGRAQDDTSGDGQESSTGDGSNRSTGQDDSARSTRDGDAPSDDEASATAADGADSATSGTAETGADKTVVGDGESDPSDENAPAALDGATPDVAADDRGPDAVSTGRPSDASGSGQQVPVAETGGQHDLAAPVAGEANSQPTATATDAAAASLEGGGLQAEADGQLTGLPAADARPSDTAGPDGTEAGAGPTGDQTISDVAPGTGQLAADGEPVVLAVEPDVIDVEDLAADEPTAVEEAAPGRGNAAALAGAAAPTVQSGVATEASAASQSESGDDLTIGTNAPNAGRSGTASGNTAGGPGSGAGRQAGQAATDARAGNAQAAATGTTEVSTESAAAAEQSVAASAATGAETAPAPIAETATAIAPGAMANGQATVGTQTSGIDLSTIGQLTAAESVNAGIEASALAPTDEADGTDPLWRQIRRALGSLRTLPTGEQQITIRLRPAELGSVVVRVNNGENGTAISLVTESSAAANQLNQQRQQLLNDLEDSGLAGVNVDIGSNADGDGAQTEGSDADGGGNGAPGTGRNETAAEQEQARGYGRRRDRGPSMGLVDVDL